MESTKAQKAALAEVNSIVEYAILQSISADYIDRRLEKNQ